MLTVNHRALGNGRLKPIVVEALKECLAQLECDEAGRQAAYATPYGMEDGPGSAAGMIGAACVRVRGPTPVPGVR